jgi:xanthine/CO dehydrogenase XdhC/CoxF family maturation factor
VIHLLLERRATAIPLLRALEEAFQRRTPIAIATVLEAPHLCCRAFAGLVEDQAEDLKPIVDSHPPNPGSLQSLANRSLADAKSMDHLVDFHETELRAWANFRSARPGLWIFGAGDDARPLLTLAKELGWFAAIADGRSHLATHERFSAADELHVLSLTETSARHSGGSPALANLRPHDAAVLMTHSFEQDAHILASLLERDPQLAYIGVLGPQRRTRELLTEVARLLNLPPTPTQIERWLSALHAPTGLDLGAESPETVAFSILAEIQLTLTASSALPLRKVRAASLVAPG